MKKIIIFWLSKKNHTYVKLEIKYVSKYELQYRNKCNVIRLIFIKEKCKRKTYGKMQ